MSTQIFTGVWTDWDRGLIHGATITLSARDGAFLLAFLAFFVTVLALRLWRLLSFALHQLLSSTGFHDGLYYQRQYILRNVTSPTAAAWFFSQQAWHWRHVADHALLRTIPAALLSAGYLLLFATASVLSSRISDGAADSRLVKSQDCGLFIPDQDFLQELRAHENREAAIYARQCYDKGSASTICSDLPVPSLPWTNSSVQCPFASSVCLDVPAFQMTTELIDSHSHLGINAPKKDRIGLRRKTVCSPLVTGPRYTISVNGTEADEYGWDDNVLIKYMYGPQGPGVDYSHIYLTYSVNANIAYNVWASTYSERGQGVWDPIDDLKVSGRDITILFIAPNSVLHLEPNTDPIFSATIEDTLSDGMRFYRPDRFVSPIACTDQYQICNPTNQICTPFEGSLALVNNSGASDIGLNTAQLGTALHIAFLMGQKSFYDLVFTRTQSFLRAQDGVASLTQQRLPSNQWEVEMSAIFSDSLALLQHQVVRYPTGPPLGAKSSVRQLWNDSANSGDETGAAFEAMCNSQRVKSSQGTLNFSVLGLGILLGFGLLIILLSFLIDPLVHQLLKVTSRTSAGARRWIRDDFLQVNRMLFDAIGAGDWDGTIGSFPRTITTQWFEFDEQDAAAIVVAYPKAESVPNTDLPTRPT